MIASEPQHNLANEYREIRGGGECGFHGDLVVPLTTQAGRIRLRGMGTGHYTFRFLMRDSRGILIHQGINKLYPDVLSSFTVTFNNMTQQGVKYPGERRGNEID